MHTKKRFSELAVLLGLIALTFILRCPAIEAAEAQTTTAPSANPEAQHVPPMLGMPSVPAIPYAVCLSHCREEKLPFEQCHRMCKDLVPLPPIQGAIQGEK